MTVSATAVATVSTSTVGVAVQAMSWTEIAIRAKVHFMKQASKQWI
jgi:hypothetical protein